MPSVAGLLKALKEFFGISKWPTSANGNPRISLAEVEAIRLTKFKDISATVRYTPYTYFSEPSFSRTRIQDYEEEYSYTPDTPIEVTETSYTTKWSILHWPIPLAGRLSYHIYLCVYGYVESGTTMDIAFVGVKSGITYGSGSITTTTEASVCREFRVHPLDTLHGYGILIKAKVNTGKGYITKIRMYIRGFTPVTFWDDETNVPYIAKVDSMGLLKVRHSLKYKQAVVGSTTVDPGSSLVVADVSGSGKFVGIHLNINGVPAANVVVRRYFDGELDLMYPSYLNNIRNVAVNSNSRFGTIDYIEVGYDDTNYVYDVELFYTREFSESLKVELKNENTTNTLNINSVIVAYLIHSSSYTLKCRVTREFGTMVADGAVRAVDVKYWLVDRVGGVVEHVALTPSEVAVDFDPYEAWEDIARALVELGVAEADSCEVVA